MKSIDDILYDIANRERNLEIERKEKLETKAQRFTTFGSIFISIISTYFLFMADNQSQITIIYYVRLILIISICFFGISVFVFLISMRVMRDITFNAEDLIKKIVDLDLNIVLGKVIGNLIQFTKVIRGVNNHKAKLLFYGISVFFAGLLLMIVGIIITIGIV